MRVGNRQKNVQEKGKCNKRMKISFLHKKLNTTGHSGSLVEIKKKKKV